MIWFSSDQHFYHTNVIRYCGRPFSSVEEMNEEMIKRWNEVVKKSDFVFHLGDFSLAARPVELFAPRLNGHKRLIPGNHDHCHPAHYGKREERGKRMREFYTNHGLSLSPDGLISKMTIASQEVILSHMPYRNIEYEEERYPKFRPIDDGKFLLHGHVHEKWTINKKMINVGCDVWNFYPVSLEQIEELIKHELQNENK